MLATNRPSESEYRSVRNYLETYKPLHRTEMDYIEHKQDLITLRPGRDHAWLDRSIDHLLHILDKPFPFLTVSIPDSAILKTLSWPYTDHRQSECFVLQYATSPSNHSKISHKVFRKTPSNLVPREKSTLPAHASTSWQALSSQS